jgi:adenine-specific DNA-methyltransferase
MTDNIKKPKDVTVAKAKGRPMLTWVGKKPLARVKAYPAQAVERFDASGGKPLPLQAADWSDWPKNLPHGGLLYHGDNKDVLAHLLANGFRGKVKLIYIDPPFDSGADYVRKVQLRGAKGTVKIDGEDYTLGEQVQYSDIWANDNYLQFMYERLLLLSELLARDGSIYVHVDARRSHQLRILLDEVFGEDGFRNQIAWKRTTAHAGAKQYGSVTDYLLFYSKGSADGVWNQQFQQLTETHRARHYRHIESDGRKYALGEMTAPGIRRGPTGEAWRGFNPTTLGRHWAKSPSELDRLDEAGLIYWPQKVAAWPRLKRYEEDSEGRACTDFWDDLAPINMVGSERENYPTQKPEDLLSRAILSSSNPGDIVLDCFIGSGTTAAVSQRLGRRWIGCDINKGAIQVAAKRLQALLRQQVQISLAPSQGELIGADAADASPCQLALATYRVNDYDLQIQHNEAVELACQHLGVTRTRTDPYFDGTQGGRLVKIVPFNHPLTPLDLEALRTELKTRPTEERDIMLVCLGWQHDARAWVDTYNRNRPVNKLQVVELRSDRKHGGIIRHEPLSASVTARREGDGTDARLVVEVQDVVSPTIMQRLNMEQGVFRAQITDWRAVVDCILIDTQHDGQVFNVALADVPERKQDFVSGRYELAAPPAGSVVAIKIIDMLGEELVVSLPT